MANGRVRWQGDQVRLVVEAATAAGLLQAAFQVEGQAKVNVVDNGQVDTGFMLNSIYAAGDGETNYGAAAAAASRQNPQEQMAPAQTPPEPLMVLVAVGAEYAIWQEERQSFLYRALEQVAPQVGGHLQQAAGEAGL